jgi:uridine phosphorylase
MPVRGRGRSGAPPLWRPKGYHQPSVFAPENLLREARRQKGLPDRTVPSLCVLDPDGDIVRSLLAVNQAGLDPHWACYHTQLYTFDRDRMHFGIIGCAVGAPFAVLVAEELFASGCQLLISVTSAGLILPKRTPPFFVLIERALRDEGTSYHYLPPSAYARLDERVLTILDGAFAELRVPVCAEATWTTDAPFRETPLAIDYARSEGIVAVEMEAAGLYALAQARQRPIICFAHVTNRLGHVVGDFDKGDECGSRDALEVIAAAARAWVARSQRELP